MPRWTSRVRIPFPAPKCLMVGAPFRDERAVSFWAPDAPNARRRRCPPDETHAARRVPRPRVVRRRPPRSAPLRRRRSVRSFGRRRAAPVVRRGAHDSRRSAKGARCAPRRGRGAPARGGQPRLGGGGAGFRRRIRRRDRRDLGVARAHHGDALVLSRGWPACRARAPLRPRQCAGASPRPGRAEPWGALRPRLHRAHRRLRLSEPQREAPARALRRGVHPLRGPWSVRRGDVLPRGVRGSCGLGLTLRPRRRARRRRRAPRGLRRLGRRLAERRPRRALGGRSADALGHPQDLRAPLPRQGRVDALALGLARPRGRREGQGGARARRGRRGLDARELGHVVRPVRGQGGRAPRRRRRAHRAPHLGRPRRVRARAPRGGSWLLREPWELRVLGR